jgi:hypothetical protein
MNAWRGVRASSSLIIWSPSLGYNRRSYNPPRAESSRDVDLFETFAVLMESKRDAIAVRAGPPAT